MEGEIPRDLCGSYFRNGPGLQVRAGAAGWLVARLVTWSVGWLVGWLVAVGGHVSAQADEVGALMRK